MLTFKHYYAIYCTACLNLSNNCFFIQKCMLFSPRTYCTTSFIQALVVDATFLKSYCLFCLQYCIIYKCIYSASQIESYWIQMQQYHVGVQWNIQRQIGHDLLEHLPQEFQNFVTFPNAMCKCYLSLITFKTKVRYIAVLFI